MKYCLEIIACSPEDALRAERGGATRLEVIREPARGGLTPSLKLVESILAIVRIPARVIVRENENYEISEASELDQLCSRAEEMAKLPLDGLVLGCTHKGKVDLHSTTAILDCAPGLRATFHHAFEAIPHPLQAISELKTVSHIDRILTHGGDGNWSQRVRRLEVYREKANPEIQILAGGGLNLERVNSIRKQTRVQEFHLGRAVRRQEDPFGSVVEAKIKEFADLLRHKDTQHQSCCQPLA
jgi:copper homeostasis protein